ncbi:putative fad- protein [Botrytis fragariae]|uniref:Putative fad- protein n=1 Tax=Botrytis fragariae TaxID=1964551 RepID=A0A8H6AU71_9HELO|nr:putative fad- protein [Botrytis fragariae]KAF5873791.1 putative fad- protein [Botrytis fragariae]
MLSISRRFSLIVTRTLLFFHVSAVLAVSTTGNSSIQCSTLERLLPKQVSYPSSTTYISSVLSYYFVQEPLSNIYKKQPDATLLSIRSGGHSPIAGAANDNGGVTIDLTLMDTLSLNRDGSMVSVGAGSIWSKIYIQLEQRNLTVLGGRVAGIGVGGLLIGGGVSFLSPQYGWACDGILGMEVVLADGSVVYASSQSHSGLFTALQGGSNNFGVVTRFDLKTFAQRELLGGFIFYNSSTVPQLLKAFNDFMSPVNFDPHASIIQAFGYQQGLQAVSMGMEYTLPIANTTPKVLQPFLEIDNQLGSTMRVSNMLNFVTEEADFQPLNTRGIYVTTTFSPNLPILTSIYDLWNATTPSISAIPSIGYSLIYQRLPATVPGNVNSFNLPSSAENLSDDETVNSVTTALMSAIEEKTKEAGVYNSFKYLNYAASWQNPLGSYGDKGKENLLSVKKTYDPQGLFQKGVPGGFKLKGLDQ